MSKSIVSHMESFHNTYYTFQVWLYLVPLKFNKIFIHLSVQTHCGSIKFLVGTKIGKYVPHFVSLLLELARIEVGIVRIIVIIYHHYCCPA